MIQPTTLSSRALFNTTQIVAHYPNGGVGKGTAFFFHFAVNEQTSVPVLITNKHVVEGADRGVFHVHEMRTDSKGEPAPADTSFAISVGDFEKQWTGHPDSDVDLCAMPFEPLRQQAVAQGKNIYNISFTESQLPTQDQLDSLAAMEDVVMVGYPIGLWDNVANLPLLRRGITATHPAIDYCGQPLGVVDMACFPGSSGSPVMILNQGTIPMPNGVGIGSRLILLGVLFAGPQHMADGTIQIVDIPTKQIPVATTSIPAHLGYYIKAREILTLKKHMFNVLNIS